MNTITTRGARTLRLAALAVPVAATLTLGGGVAAQADDSIDPVLVQVVSLDDDLDPTVPVGPGDLTTEDDCEQTDTCGGGGEDPGTDDPNVPEGPGDITTEDDCQQTDTCGGGGDDGDDPGTHEPGTDEPGTDGGEDYDKPTRIDAGTADAATTAAPDTGLTLAWVLPGGLLVTAAGLAFAARRVRADGGS